MHANDDAGFELPSQRHPHELSRFEPAEQFTGNRIGENAVARGSDGWGGDVGKWKRLSHHAVRLHRVDSQNKCSR
jgi:hypothetical protein